MSHAQLEKIVEAAFEDRANVTPATTGEVRDAVNEALNLLDTGAARVAYKVAGKSGPEAWAVNQWLKKAVLLSFRLNDMWAISGAPGGASWRAPADLRASPLRETNEPCAPPSSRPLPSSSSRRSSAAPRPPPPSPPTTRRPRRTP